MKKIMRYKLWGMCFFAFLFFIHQYCYAQPISSTELINNAKQYDGKTVIYRGEVIGDIMARKDYVWLNVNDGVNAIGVWIDKNLSRNIVYTGSFKFRGDIVEIEGVFHRACLEHGGDLDVHAWALRRIVSGMAVRDRLDIHKKNLVILLLGILCLILILNRLKRK